ncbi:regulatory protein, MarR [Luminiphilus syltensis NOR5-1B]|uniref:Regulatory protein, MarR n=1 Tax=Luminiphilus syltensis NOR5-1B TaxID=565045 RepID=B8KX85_9GAMM|nr:MarR family transcriptional regulator [Luminiphilus syltensis]EED36210.1 regulatory protein, MarR [Luminiphilus syltensis NOR5-1B]
MNDSMPDDSAPEQANEFIEHMGRVARADGLPRIAGRLFGFFILYGGPCALGELAVKLEVSRGSVSTNTRLLEQLGLLERVSRRGDRKDYFQLTADPFPALLRGIVARARDASAGIAHAHADLPDSWKGAKARLADLDAFYQRIHKATEGIVGSYENGAEDHAKS